MRLVPLVVPSGWSTGGRDGWLWEPVRVRGRTTVRRPWVRALADVKDE